MRLAAGQEPAREKWGVGRAVQQQTAAKNGYYIVYLFTIGLFLGILIVNLGYDTWIGEGSLLGTDMILRLKNSIPDGNGLFGYVLKHRMFTVCLLGLLATTMIGLPAVCGYVCYMGLSAGCLLSVAVIRYGIRGLFLMAAGIFPQGILLIPGYAALFLWAVGVNRMLYAHGMGREYYGGYGRQSYLKKGMQMAGIIAVIIVGCILESYVNPKMLQFVLKIF
ncbi:MAG: hypothetical protein HFI58_01215 [Lachnospiraceae bacterium]|jgi:stage II sporulation protein M|nr:hypothetical protein [Lachnospiraceae bacterium]MCI8986791.1 hypothetical protein [Lachnospiraceae bacterium]MCI9012843.1 hypothetical protein [Lachnospiraceae bacterium]MCI9253448.1 hypothetical protein [Lachnospiraceae bacterium]